MGAAQLRVGCGPATVDRWLCEKEVQKGKKKLNKKFKKFKKNHKILEKVLYFWKKNQDLEKFIIWKSSQNWKNTQDLKNNLNFKKKSQDLKNNLNLKRVHKTWNKHEILEKLWICEKQKRKGKKKERKNGTTLALEKTR